MAYLMSVPSRRCCSGRGPCSQEIEPTNFRLLFELAEKPVLLLLEKGRNQMLALRWTRPAVDVDANRLIGACGDVAHVQRPAVDDHLVCGARAFDCALGGFDCAPAGTRVTIAASTLATTQAVTLALIDPPFRCTPGCFSPDAEIADNIRWTRVNSEPELGTPLEDVEVSSRSTAIQDAVPVVEFDPPVLFRIPGDGAGDPRHRSSVDGAIGQIDVRISAGNLPGTDAAAANAER